MKNRILKICLILTLMAFMPLYANAAENLEAQIIKIEKEVWGFTYDNDTDEKRVERLENQIFGKNHINLSIEKRVDKLTTTLGLESQDEQKADNEELYAHQKAGEGVEYPQIDELENVLLGSIYKTDSIFDRIERLEKKVFGRKQEGDLSQRTEKLKNHAQAKIPKKEEYFARENQTQIPSFNFESSSDTKLQLSALENMVLGADYSTEPVSSRLSRLENKIFQRSFAEDDDNTRITRLQVTMDANKSAKYYDNNKFQKYASTGIQAASFILMLLAFIL